MGVTVLITGCSRHSNELVCALKQNEDNVPVSVIATDMNPSRVLRKGTDAQYILPPISDTSYISCLKAVSSENGVDVIIPYITSELELISAFKDEFLEIGTHVSVASPETLRVLNSKIELYARYSEYMPKQIVARTVGQARAALAELSDMKICCKIADGCGGAGFAVVDDSKSLDPSLFNRRCVPRYVSESDVLRIVDNANREIMLQEYKEGTDYSVCVLAKNGVVTDMCGYFGYDMEYGAVVNGEIAKNDEAYSIARHVAEAEHLDGNACFDFIITSDGKAFLLECNPRVNASLGFVWHAGCNMPWKRCKHLLGEKTEPSEINYGLRMSKYYEAEYV